MPKFSVNIEEVCSYGVIVEADTADAAEKAALERLINAPDLSMFFVSCSNREVLNVEEVTDV
jgi:hypothetical protein